MNIFRIYVEKKDQFNVKAESLLKEFVDFLGVKTVKNVRFLERYDIEGITKETYDKALNTVLADPATDYIYEEEVDLKGSPAFAESFLSGQYDQQAHSFVEYIGLIQSQENVRSEAKPLVKVARIYAIEGDVSQEDMAKIKNYVINPVEAEEVAMEKLETLKVHFPEAAEVAILTGFINMDQEALKAFHDDEGLAMNMGDLAYFQNYFIKENRDPSYTEIKVVDTYWSDHCRHATFMTELSNIEIEEGDHSAPVVAALKSYREARQRVYGDTTRPETLMDMAVIQTKDLKKQNKIPKVVFSAEINACTIEETIQVDGKDEKWLILFKNETHNHPTEIEPFGGAGTCLGGAIRDPLSGRAYVYQAMRITGCADPTEAFADTLEGKLPQRVITKTAANGYSAYGNEIGIAAGEIKEYYHPGFKAKRMELGAVVGAIKSDAVIREEPLPGDIVVMIGGPTGRDGCGGATGSSKVQTEDVIEECGSEVQKGNPKEERKLMRLYRNPEFSKMIKRCNDFGAGGVSVAIGELADGLHINLDKVTLKYPGLDGTEIAISESQERMAIVVAAKHEVLVRQLCHTENVPVEVVATVTEEPSLVMTWRGKEIVNISRSFLDSAGVEAKRDVYIEAPKFTKTEKELTKANILHAMASLDGGLQKGLAGQFDSTIGAGTVLMPYGGSKQLTKEQGMVAKIPLVTGETDSATYMTHGYDPEISTDSPFHGALYAVVESIAKLVALGADYKESYLSFQEYFERLDEDKTKWGKPAAALLGALTAKQQLGLAAIGGKDSMSGTFKDITVPPTLVSFTCLVGSAAQCVSASFKADNHGLIYLPIEKDENNMPDFEMIKAMYQVVTDNAKKGKVFAAQAIGKGGLVAAIANMSIGNAIGCEVFDPEILGLPNAFEASYGDMILEIDFEDIEEFMDAGFVHIGETNAQNFITFGDQNIFISEIIESIKRPLAGVFNLAEDAESEASCKEVKNKDVFRAKNKVETPKVILPVFSGTNGEYDLARAFEKAGAEVEQVLFHNQTAEQIKASIVVLIEKIASSQIVALSGGSYKAMSVILQNPDVKKALEKHTNEEDGLIIGIAGGFQALVKSGILPYGTFTNNAIGRYVSDIVTTKITATTSPWLANVGKGNEIEVAVSNHQLEFVTSDETFKTLVENGQIFSQYTNKPSNKAESVEGIISKDGRIIGKMGHSERVGDNIHKNIPGRKEDGIFKAAVAYYQ
ncbi:MAG TPA: phosphoribosylformylglycinamidine synthase [Epulopiscium sp.]|nr:phosphoribosylformylglycinamidine synthase [Candidatus Epulonipiscium sp.]